MVISLSFRATSHSQKGHRLRLHAHGLERRGQCYIPIVKHCDSSQVSLDPFYRSLPPVAQVVCSRIRVGAQRTMRLHRVLAVLGLELRYALCTHRADAEYLTSPSSRRPRLLQLRFLEGQRHRERPRRLGRPQERLPGSQRRLQRPARLVPRPAYPPPQLHAATLPPLDADELLRRACRAGQHLVHEIGSLKAGERLRRGLQGVPGVFRIVRGQSARPGHA